MTTAFLAVTTDAAGRGLTQQVRFESDPTAAAAFALATRCSISTEYEEQMRLAGEYVQAFQGSNLASLSGVPRDPVSLRVTFEPDVELEGGSHGLMFLIAGIARLMQVPLRLGRVFSAALAPPETAEHIYLAPVTGIPEKAIAAGGKGAQSLHYHQRADGPKPAEDERIRRYMLEGRFGTLGHECRLAALPSRVSWANLINLSQEVQGLWLQLSKQPRNAEAVLTWAGYLVRDAVTHPSEVDEYPVGLGKAIAELRGRGSCPPNAVEALGIPRFAAMCAEAHLADLAKAAISESAERTIEEDYAWWLSGRSNTPELRPDIMPLARSIWLFDLGCREGWIPAAAQHVPALQLSRRFAELARSLAGASKVVEAELAAATQALLRMSTKREDLLVAASSALDATFAQAQGGDGQALAARLRRRCAPAGEAIPQREPELTITFGPLADGAPTEPGCPRCAREWIGPATNGLSAKYAVPGASATVPSPVLLLEDADGIGRFSQRIDYRGSDNTPARLPKRAFETARYLFNRVPARIEYVLRRDGDSPGVPVGVHWDHTYVAFPPPIDSQFLVSALQRWRLAGDADPDAIHSIIDVGCGTGYLAAAAAFLFPGVREVLLADLDGFTTDYAAANLAYAIREPGSGASGPRSVAPDAKIGTWSVDFRYYRPSNRVDLLVANPPYLPELQLAGGGIERATYGTKLLEHVVVKAPELARFTWLVFTSLSWREFELAIAQVINRFQRIVVFDRQVCPLRVPPILPIHPDEDSKVEGYQYRQRVEYYHSVLQPRGLIDLDQKQTDWEHTLANIAETTAPWLFRGTPHARRIEDVSSLSGSRLPSLLSSLREHSRGFRFWHETRVVLLESLKA